ncbi:MAG TPA: diguanylate cyclase [Thermoanaerobaculia bacterium]|nr:diguanylate cyclase [Thermoanaerobaculia bacterium]
MTDMPNIILVEDDEHVSHLLSRQLTRAGYAVRAAGTITEARELVRDGEWDIAVLDRGLPDGDGLELCSELRRSSPHGYIVMLTGENSAEAKLEGFKQGADDYVTKPFVVDELLARIRAGVRIVHLQKALIDSNRRLEELSLTDGLTSLRNRRAFDERLEDAFEQARRYERPLSLILIDVDYFKPVNDAFGHDTGDEVLKGVAELIAASTRQADFVARIGGEEFAVLLPETPLFEAMQVAEKIRARIATTPVATLATTVSLGVANALHSRVTSTSDLFHAADQALYRAKANGRNRTEMERRRELRAFTPVPVERRASPRRLVDCSAG